MITFRFATDSDVPEIRRICDIHADEYGIKGGFLNFYSEDEELEIEELEGEESEDEETIVVIKSSDKYLCMFSDNEMIACTLIEAEKRYDLFTMTVVQINFKLSSVFNPAAENIENSMSTFMDKIMEECNNYRGSTKGCIHIDCRNSETALVTASSHYTFSKQKTGSHLVKYLDKANEINFTSCAPTVKIYEPAVLDQQLYIKYSKAYENCFGKEDYHSNTSYILSSNSLSTVGSIVVTEHVDGIIGFASILKYDCENQSEDTIDSYIDQVFVLPHLRKMGIGKRIMENALSIAFNNGCRNVSTYLTSKDKELLMLLLSLDFYEYDSDNHFTKEV